MSIHHVQRRLSIGYARAAGMIDQMEKKGIVSPREGSKPRKVLKKDNFCSKKSSIRRIFVLPQITLSMHYSKENRPHIHKSLTYTYT